VQGVIVGVIATAVVFTAKDLIAHGRDVNRSMKELIVEGQTIFSESSDICIEPSRSSAA